MKRWILYFLLIECLAFPPKKIYSQQGNIWYFGKNAGLSFNSPTPKALTDGGLNTFEGCASLCDNTGNLLFYTDGIHVWNKNNQVMPNGTGLKGDPSSSNSAIVIPKPGSDSIYYIFTSDAAENNNAKGYNYSEVDMSLNGGLGDVTSNKNIVLYAPSTEKITAVRNINGVDIWVITHEWGNNKWAVFKVDCNGVNPIPVISTSGSIYAETVLFSDANGTRPINSGSVGCLKASADGKKIATTRADATGWEIFNFDNASGTVTDGIQISNFSAYGLEFSPDSKLIYVASERWGYDTSYITQYDLAIFNAISISNSGIRIGASAIGQSLVDNSIGALQIGPDNRIYCALEENPSLAVINDPNTKGMGCSFVNGQIDLNGRLCHRGLPVFFPGLITNRNALIDVSLSNDCMTANFKGSATMSGTLLWDWDFGDGTFATGQNVTHVFQRGTMDTVILTVTATTVCGTSRVKATKFINLVDTTPTSKFGFSAHCGNPTVVFTDSSYVQNGVIQSWLWDFGDGTTSAVKNPTHTYSGIGNFPVTLLIISSATCNGTNLLRKTVAIESKPIADFSVLGLCLNKAAKFADNSSIGTGSITKWYWNFGDGHISTEQFAQNTYKNADTYSIQLVTTSSTGCVSDTLKKNIIVNNIPKVDFFTKNGCINDPIILSDSSTVSPGTINQWQWLADNQLLSNTKSTSVHFQNSGPHTIKLVVGSDNNCYSDTLEKTIAIDDIPIVDFDIKNGCVGNLFTIQNNLLLNAGKIQSYEVNWGDGQNSTQLSPAHIYTTGDNFIIKEIAKTINGCESDTVFKTINIETNPSVDFIFDSVCAGRPILFKNLTTNNAGAITTWIWTFGTNDKSYEYEPKYTYHNYGTYTVSVSATTQNGCTTLVAKDITINKVNIFAGNDTTVSQNQPLLLTASGGVSYSWAPSSYLSNSVIAQPTASLPGNWTYFLTGITKDGCIGHDTINIKVYKGPEVYVPNAFTPNGDFNNDILRPVAAGIKELKYFTVYNRWGQPIFSTKEIGKGWDGKINGVLQPSGTFVWILNAVTYEGKLIQKKGSFLLIH